MNSSRARPGIPHVPTQRRASRPLSTCQTAPHCQSSPWQTASSIRGAASWSVCDSASARAVSNSTRCCKSPGRSPCCERDALPSVHLTHLRNASITLRLLDPGSGIGIRDSGSRPGSTEPGFQSRIAIPVPHPDPERKRFVMAQPAPTYRILLVDDDRGLRHVLSALLQEAGHRVESAGDGPEALEILGEGSCSTWCSWTSGSPA